MKLIPLFVLFGMFAVSGWAEEKTIYSPELVKNAESGDAKAQFDLGACYSKGDGVTQDYKEAVKWYTKSAEQGNAEAQFCLGICYEGNGVTPDWSKAVKWLTKSAEQGNAVAQVHLAGCYEYGNGVAKDEKEKVSG